jgi:lipoprotein-releasing system permease protein
MSFPWFIASRYLVARRRQAFVSLISAVSILGVGVGVMALVIALALMTGVQNELRDRIVGSTAHVYVNKFRGAFEAAELGPQRWARAGVSGAAPAILGYGLITTGNGRPEFATLKGIDPAREPEVTAVGPAMISGSLAALANRPPEELDGVVLGAELARVLGVGVGDVVDAVTSELGATLGGMTPRRRPLKVVGTFRIGFYPVDSQWAMVSLQTAAELLNRQGPDMVQLSVTNLDEAPALRDQLQQELGPDYLVQDWTQLNQPLYSALWLEKVAISLTIGLIVMVAALNIVASLVLLVMEKSRDIAILRTMGAPARFIRRIFIYQGLTIGLVGTAAGTLLGLIVCYLADRYQLVRLPADVYQVTHVPFHVRPLDLAIVVLSAIGICLLATLYPSRQAGRIDPAEALRNS